MKKKISLAGQLNKVGKVDIEQELISKLHKDSIKRSISLRMALNKKKK
jgi:hypothetical protein